MGKMNIKALFRRRLKLRSSSSKNANGSGSSGGGSDLTASSSGELERVFKKFDTNGDGKISSSELAAIFETLGDGGGGGHPLTGEELSRMMAEADSGGGGGHPLSARELQLVLVYFAQEGRDSYCALEVFDWLRKENRVDDETKELMVSIACGWIERLIGGDHTAGDVVELLNEMDCVGLEPGFSMMEKVVSLYWEREKKEEAVGFVRDVVRRGGAGGYVTGEEGEDGRGGS